MPKVSGLTETTSLDDADLVYAVDTSEGVNGSRKINKANLKTTLRPTPAEIKSDYESNSDTNAFTDAEKTKLSGVEVGAKDDQSASEVPYNNATSGLTATNVQTAIDEVESRVDSNESDISLLQSGKQDLSEKAQANGYASLDGTGKIPTSQIPDSILSSMTFKGTWNADTNTPDIGGSSPDSGDFYIVNVAGSTNLAGITDWKVGDWAVYHSATSWQKIDNTDQVVSVFGRQGAIAAQNNDYSASQVAYTPGLLTDWNGSSDPGQTSDAIDQAISRVKQNETNFAAHTNGGPSKHDANEIDYERSDGSKTSIQAASDDVESALSDLDDNKLARSGVQSMTGALNMGTNNITNAGTVNGVAVASHGSRHAGNGADPVPSATQSVSGLMSATDKTKLDSISHGIIQYRNGSNQNVTTAGTTDYVDVPVDTNTESNLNSLFQKNTTSEFQVLYTGRVQVSYSVAARPLGGNDRPLRFALFRDTGGGFVKVLGSERTINAKATAQAENSCAVSIQLPCTNGDKYRLRMRTPNDGGETGVILADLCLVSLQRVNTP